MVVVLEHQEVETTAAAQAAATEPSRTHLCWPAQRRAKFS